MKGKITKELAVEAFELRDLIVRGEMTGGIEAPRLILSVREPGNNSVEILWKNPRTCGYSDRIYHYEDLSPHKDVYAVINDKLEVNGRQEDFGMNSDIAFIIQHCWNHIENFCRKWSLKEPGPSRKERERIISAYLKCQEESREKIAKLDGGELPFA